MAEEELNIYSQITETMENNILSRLIVVRHAESFANTEGRYQGQTYDTDLSELGRKQAEALAASVKDLGIKKIVSSPLRRTYQTAMEISRLIDIPVEINNSILETNHGLWEGQHKDWIVENFADLYKMWQTAPSKVAFPEGETFIDTFERVKSFVEGYEPSTDALVVTHDNVVRILVTLANGWALDEIWRHEIEPASLNFFEINKVAGKNKLKILKLNDNEHLEGLKADLTKHAL